MNKNIKYQRIVYVNFAPYENAGHILDYLLDNYETVILFCFNFHKLTNKEEPSLLKIFKHKQVIQTKKLYYIPTPQALVFVLLPLRSAIIFMQLILHIIKLRFSLGKIDTYFTVNAFTAWCGILLQKFKLVNRTIFWIWDYYPPVHESKVVMFMRWLYWLFDKPATLYSDKIVFLNKKLIELRKKHNILKKDKSYVVVEIGTNPVKKIQKKRLRSINLVFLGVVKKSQGLDLVYNSAEELKENFPSLSITIIGSGPEELYFKKRAKNTKLKTTFLGFISDDKIVDKTIKNGHIGLASYIPEESNVSYYSDPSKIKRYISSGIPIITTNVFDFSKSIHKYKAGVVINYDQNELIRAIKLIIKSYSSYQKNALALSEKYKYSVIYNKIFD